MDAIRLSAGISQVSVVTTQEEVSPLRQRVGIAAARFYAARGWELRSTRADLALLARSFEGFLATKCLLAASGLLVAPILAAWIPLMGWDFQLSVPLWSAILIAVLF